MDQNDLSKISRQSLRFEVMDDSDSRLTKVKIFIAHTGMNRNYSSFSKAALESMIPSLMYQPILGFVDSKTEDFKGHEEKVTINADGEGDFEVEYLGVPYGFVPAEEHANPRFEMLKCEDDVTREFLVTDAYLWTGKYPKINEIFDASGGAKSQSMELCEVDGKWDENYIYHIESAKIDGLCVLGEGVTPAMISSSISKYCADEAISEMLTELSSYFSSKVESKEKDEEPAAEDFTASKSNEPEVTPETDEGVDKTFTEDSEGDEVPDTVETDFTENQEDSTDDESDNKSECFESKYNEVVAELNTANAALAELQEKYTNTVEIQAKYDELLKKYTALEASKRKEEFNAKVLEFATKYELTDEEVNTLNEKFETIEYTEEALKSEVGLIVMNKIETNTFERFSATPSVSNKRSSKTRKQTNPESKGNPGLDNWFDK